MGGFGSVTTAPPGSHAVSIKVRVTSGCFHREHSPDAYAAIDRHLAALPARERTFRFEEHESGPEVLLWLAVTTAGLTLAKSVVELLTAIVKARSEGAKRGDKAADQAELVIRRVTEAGAIKEEVVLRIPAGTTPSERDIHEHLTKAAQRLLPPAPTTSTTKSRKPKKASKTRTNTKKRK